MQHLSAMTIAGSYSGGGAGVQADLKTFSALGVYWTSAITAITAQNTRGVSAVGPVSPATVSAQNLRRFGRHPAWRDQDRDARIAGDRCCRRRIDRGL